MGKERERRGEEGEAQERGGGTHSFALSFEALGFLAAPAEIGAGSLEGFCCFGALSASASASLPCFLFAFCSPSLSLLPPSAAAAAPPSFSADPP